MDRHIEARINFINAIRQFQATVVTWSYYLEELTENIKSFVKAYREA